jgi:hypothetical protein
MKYAVEMGSGGMIYVPSFIKIGSGIQKLMGGVYRQHADCINLLPFFQKKEGRPNRRRRKTGRRATSRYVESERVRRDVTNTVVNICFCFSLSSISCLPVSKQCIPPRKLRRC